MGLWLLYNSAWQRLGAGALLEQEEARTGTILDTGISEGKTIGNISLSTGEQYHSQG